LTDEQMCSVMNTARILPRKLRNPFLDRVSDLLMAQLDECSGLFSDGITDGLVFDAIAASLACYGAAVSRGGRA
jgi:hypothetical protein